MTLPRFIATVAHSKHRFFVWLPISTSPDQALITFARADDTTFGLKAGTSGVVLDVSRFGLDPTAHRSYSFALHFDTSAPQLRGGVSVIGSDPDRPDTVYSVGSF